MKTRKALCFPYIAKGFLKSKNRCEYIYIREKGNDEKGKEEKQNQTTENTLENLLNTRLFKAL